MIGLSEKSSDTRDRVDVKRVFTFSILYLPMLFVFIAADVAFSIALG
jgi:heme O synthase-like polyprenyltransferase